MHPKIITNDKDSKIFSSSVVVPSENEIWAIKKNSGSGIKTINTLCHKFLPDGYFHRSGIDSSLAEKSDYKDSLFVEYGKCSKI